MLELLRHEANMTRTENGAAAYRSTLSACLDLFADIGAIRHEPDEAIIARFVRAYAEDATLAMRTLFFGRDVRGGLGERRVFRVIVNWLAEHEPEALRRNITHIPEYGRYDDLLALLGTACEADALAMIRDQLARDLASEEGVSLLAKWLPSVNASNADTVRMGRRIARALGMSDARYRRTLVQLRRRIRILENNLRERDYSFDYQEQPSRAMYRYRQAFLRNDAERYNEFREQVAAGRATLHTGALMPYDVIAPCVECRPHRLSWEERRAIDVTWRSLEDFGGTENALAVVDGSGSMYAECEPMPAAVALSLGIYFAERNTGAFHNHFITFSEHPQLVEIRGGDIVERVRCCASYNEVANTNIQRVFELILRTAVQNHLPQEELPTRLYIISDMEFDSCAEGASVTCFERARQMYARCGYRLPQVVFWNVAARSRGRNGMGQHPVTMNKQGVALVSGCTPRLFQMVAGGELSPMRVMMDVLGSPRYARISA